MTNLMQGKRGLIMGVANDHSIAWGIAKALSQHGAELAFTYQGDALGRRVKPLAESLGSKIILPCDVEDIASVDATFDALKKQWGTMDFLVHAIGFSDKNELKGRYADTTRKNFERTMVISCFSFTEAAKRAAAMMPNGGSMITLTYNGGDKAMPNYNVMGLAKAALESSVRYLAVDYGLQNIRVNAISAGPIRTLAGAGINDARYMFAFQQRHSPLGRGVSLEDLGGSGLYLLSDLSAGVTGRNPFRGFRLQRHRDAAAGRAARRSRREQGRCAVTRSVMATALERSYDGIIIGAGHHGLVLGSYLAKSGLDILIVDRRLQYGGGLSTQEVTVPGFHHNLHSINHFHITETPWFKDLNLGERVTYLTPRYELGQPHLDGTALVFGRDLEETLANVARFSKKDAQTFRDWNRRAEEITRRIFLPERYSEPLPQAERDALLSRSAIGRDFLEITKRQPFEVVKELFENEHVQLLFLFKVSLFGTWLVDTMSGTSPMGSVIRAFDLESGYQLCQGGSFNLARG